MSRVSPTTSSTSAFLKVQKPLLKWVGGKTQILNQVMGSFPPEMNNYHEPFLGGGSVLLALLSNQRAGNVVVNGSIFAYDANSHLIHVYQHIQKNKDSLYDHIMVYMDMYASIRGTTVVRAPATPEEAATSQESYYYWLRAEYNGMEDKTSVKHAALFMVLNKTCFRGMYREGPRGYNVPYGHYTKLPTVVTRQELDNVSSLIQPVEFVSCDFGIALARAEDGDFVYVDPPYAPTTSTSFVGYTAGGFTLDAHTRLFDALCEMKDKRVRFAMSNAQAELVTSRFSGAPYSRTEILARRAINAKNPDATAMEVIVRNW